MPVPEVPDRPGTEEADPIARDAVLMVMEHDPRPWLSAQAVYAELSRMVPDHGFTHRELSRAMKVMRGAGELSRKWSRSPLTGAKRTAYYRRAP